MVASSIAGGFVLTIVLSGAHAHASLEFKRLYFLLTSSVLEDPWYTIKGRGL